MVLVFSRIDLSRNFEDYITVDHAVVRSLSGEQMLCWYVGLGKFTDSPVVNLVILAEQSAVCGKSYIDEPVVGTVILPQIGELPVHLSIGGV